MKLWANTLWVFLTQPLTTLGGAIVLSAYPLYRLCNAAGGFSSELDKMFIDPNIALTQAIGDDPDQEFIVTLSNLIKIISPNEAESGTDLHSKLDTLPRRLVEANLEWESARDDFKQVKENFDTATTTHNNYCNSNELQPIIKLAKQILSTEINAQSMYEDVISTITPQILFAIEKSLEEEKTVVLEKVVNQSEKIMYTFEKMLDIIDNVSDALTMADINSILMPNIEALSGAIIVVSAALSKTTEVSLEMTQALDALLFDITCATNSTKTLVWEAGNKNKSGVKANITPNWERGRFAEKIRENLLTTNRSLDSAVAHMSMKLDPMYMRYSAFENVKGIGFNYADQRFMEHPISSTLYFEDVLEDSTHRQTLRTARGRQYLTLNYLLPRLFV